MNLSISGLAAGVIFGIIGMFVFKTAKSSANIPNLILGLVLMLYPYFTDNLFLLWGIGIAVSALAYKLKDSY